MNRHVNAIAGRLSLRPPQRQSLEILDRVTEIAPPKKGADVAAALAALAAIRSEFPSVTDFERDFPSICFALATGVGKTRLMGAFIAYLHLARGIDNFFVLAPNLTIYDKLIADFTPNTPKYVFKGIAEFATNRPEIITGDTYDQRSLLGLIATCKINIFNISKINSEVRGGKSPRIKRLSEYLGESYFDYLASLPDLVILMDESHRYRASAGVRAINELKPILGLELTATPFVDSGKTQVPFKNVVLDYPLGRAMEDGFVKEPAVVTRKDFSAAGMSPEEIERLKLEDGIRLHEQTKVELETYAREKGQPIVKPFVLVIARDTTHASDLKALIEGDGFFDGRYRGRAIEIHSGASGDEKDDNVARLLRVESAEEPTEIVIHVNMLKEGWDVTNLYTIVPLRAANARILIEQSIGRGLRLPYGARTGVEAVDRLNIVAHDRFQEIVDEASRPESPIRLKSVVLEPSSLAETPVVVISRPNLESKLAPRASDATRTSATLPDQRPAPAFEDDDEQRAALLALDAIRTLAKQPARLPGLAQLADEGIRREIVQHVENGWIDADQPELPETRRRPDFDRIVRATTELVMRETIAIPRIAVTPKSEQRSGFERFDLALDGLRYQPPSEELWVRYLRTAETSIVDLGDSATSEQRLEDYVVSGLVDFDDVAYDEQSDVLYNLASQVVAHLRGYLSEADTAKVLRVYQREIARFVHVQMQDHFWQNEVEYDVEIREGFVPLKESAYSTTEPPRNFREAPEDKSRIARYVFGGFSRCLYPLAKFQSDPERRLAVILERESEKWFRPAAGQFQIVYRDGIEIREYQPDFVAETADCIFMLEPKKAAAMTDADVLAKRAAAETWCERASDHSKRTGGKTWRYVLIPDDLITENMTLKGLIAAVSRRS